MYFLIDGYNLLFSCSADQRSLEIQRGGLLTWMQQQFSSLNLTGIIVFDGGHQFANECDISYRSPLEIAYTPKGKSADLYIVECLSYLKNPKIATIVTNDKGLLSHCREYSSNSLSSESFVQWLLKKSKRKKDRARHTPKESSYQIDRLTKIFEERLKSDE
jgi:predicted RNA-binding protein with PIN domain